MFSIVNNVTLSTLCGVGSVSKISAVSIATIANSSF